jgi:hypothetical protein
MTTISPDAKILTAVNVLSVEPKDQAQVVELLSRASDILAETQPGFMQLYSQIKEIARPEPNAYEIVHAAHGGL